MISFEDISYNTKIDKQLPVLAQTNNFFAYTTM